MIDLIKILESQLQFIVNFWRLKVYYDKQITGYTYTYEKYVVHIFSKQLLIKTIYKILILRRHTCSLIY